MEEVIAVTINHVLRRLKLRLLKLAQQGRQLRYLLVI